MSEEMLYREELECGPPFSKVERGNGYSQESWDLLTRHQWEESMLVKAQLLGLEDPPFAEEVKARRRREIVEKSAAQDRLSVARLEQSAAGLSLAGAVLHAIFWIGVCYLLFKALR